MKKRHISTKSLFFVVFLTAFFTFFFTTAKSFSYWVTFLNIDSKDKNYQVSVGEWLPEDVDYIVNDEEQLFDVLSDHDPGEVIVLTQDIEVDLGESFGKFDAVFDGNGNTITGNLTSESFDALDNGHVGFGLFGDLTINGTIKNLTLEICLQFEQESGSDNSAYYFGGIAAFNSGIIDNVHVKKKEGCGHAGLSVNFHATKNGALVHMGGLVGENKGTIINSSSEIDVDLTFRNGGSVTIGQTQTVWIGGLVGKNVNKNNNHIPVEYRAKVIDSINYGKINVHVYGRKVLLSKSTTNVTMGGISGYNDGGTHTNITYNGTINDLTYSRDDNDRGSATIKLLVGNQ